MFGLPLSWVLMGAGVLLVGSNLFTAIKVADYVQDQNDLQNLTAQVAVVERERVVEILDKKTLETALAKQAETFQNRLGVERVFNDLLQKRLASNKPWCDLNDDELRVWNAENAGAILGDNQLADIKRGRELSKGTPTL